MGRKRTDRLGTARGKPPILEAFAQEEPPLTDGMIVKRAEYLKA